jgi:PAS domain S-box-containing protein
LGLSGKLVGWRRRCRRLLRVGAVAAALVVAGLLAVGAWLLWTERDSARALALSGTADLLAALDGDVARTIETYDLSLQSFADSLRLPGAMALPPELRHAVLFDRAASAPYFGSLVRLDRDGRTVISSTGIPPGTSFALRDYFQVQRSASRSELYVGVPFVAWQSGQPSLSLSRRLVDGEGKFDGLVVGTIQLAYLSDVFSRLHLGGGSALTLVRNDGTVIARAPFRPKDLGRNLGGTRLMRAAFEAPDGVYDGPSPGDGVRRLHVFRRVGDLPLTLIAGISPAAVDAPWWGKVRVASAAALGLVLLGVVLGLALRRELRRRDRAERAVRRAQARFKTLFEHAPDGLFIVHANAEGLFRYEAVNPAFCKGLGVEPDQVLGRPAGVTLSPGDAQSLQASYAACLREQRPTSFSVTSIGPNGPREWQGLVAPVPDTRDGEALLVGSARDVTERNRAEAEQRQAQKMDAMGQLTAGIAHDFNNLLQVVLGGLEMAGERLGGDAEAAAQLDLAHGAARRGAALTARLLTAARRQTLAGRPTDLGAVLAEAADLFRRTLGPQVEIETDARPGTWLALADPDQLQTALLNLTINARDAMPRGGTLRLGARNARVGEAGDLQIAPGDHVVVRVEDDGTGMDAATLTRACDPFFTTKAFGKGSGLGLAMVHGFARQSQGDLRITSAPDRGTAIELWLPRAASAMPVPPSVVPAARSSVAVRPGIVPHVLLVDDDAPVRRMLTLFLERAGCTVAAVDSAVAALEMLSAGLRPDLLVTDHAMPGLSGADLLRFAHARLPGLPALLVTGYDEVTERETLPPSAHVLLKPFQRGDFIAEVGALLAEGEASSAPERAAA